MNKLIAEAKKREQDETNRLSKINTDYPYKRIQILTPAELQLYNFMRNNLCGIEKVEILTKVRLADLVEVDSNITKDKAYFYRIASKHVDYVICEKKTMNIICVVELDDYTHDVPERKLRDEFVMMVLKSADIKTIRIKQRICDISVVDLRPIEKEINIYFAPDCPLCKGLMQPKERRKDKHRFYSCKKCKYTIDIDVCGGNIK